MLKISHQEAFYSDAASVIAGLASKVVRKPSDIIDLLRASSHVPVTSGDNADINQDVRDATLMHICRYLRGHGHPDHPRLDGVVTNDMREVVAEDTTYCLRSFLLLMSGSSMLPVSEAQKLYVRQHLSASWCPNV
jgi:hypothetical protein